MLYKNGTTDPFFDYNVGGEYHDGYETKITAYASDSWAVTPWLDLSYGANFRYQKMEGDYSLQPRVAANTVLHQPFTTFNHDWYHLNGDLRTVINLHQNLACWVTSLIRRSTDTWKIIQVLIHLILLKPKHLSCLEVFIIIIIG